MLPPHLEPLAAIAPPAAIAVCLAIAARLRREPLPGSPPSVGWSGVLVALAVAGSVLWLRGDWPGFPPRNVNAWPLFTAIGAAAVAATANLSWRWFAPMSLLVVAAALPGLLTVPLRGWALSQAAMGFAVFGTGWLTLVLGTRALAAGAPAAILPAWAGALAVSAWMIADPVTAKHHGFILAAAGVAAGILGLARLVWGPRVGTAAVACAIAVAAPPCLILAYAMTDNLPAPAAGLLAAAPLAATLLALPLRRWPWPAAITAAVLAAAVAASAWFLLSAAVRSPAPAGWG